MKQFALINARIVTHEEIFEGAVIVKNGKIFKVMRGKSARVPAKMKVLDVQGNFLLPGAIDVHVHFRTPGMTQKEDWTTGSKAALAGGVTTVLDMPNNQPPIVDAKSLAQKRKLVAAKSLVNFGLYAGATPDNILTITKLKGTVGVKVFMGSSTGSLLLDSREKLEKLFERAAKDKKLLAIHAESEQCILENSALNSGDDPAIHSKSRPPECAYEAVKEVLHLAKKYGTRVHLCHVSTEKELEVISKFKNPNVSAEVTPHHLFLTDQDYEQYGNLVKVNPPLRAPADQVAMWSALKSGLIDMVATDHAPHLLSEKKLPYEKAPSGVPGVQTMLPLLLNAVSEGKLTLPQVVTLTSYHPARMFGMLKKGFIRAGFDADFTLVDMGLCEKVCHDYLWSKCGWSPFHGWILQGWPVMTFVAGELMYEWRESFGKKKGREVKNLLQKV